MATKSGFVAILGKPNSGKSTLLNAILGEKLSIVTPKPQTTRKRVLGIYSTDYTQIVFLDNPGVIEPRYELQRSMMGYISESLRDADILAVLLDSAEFHDAKRSFHSIFLDAIKRAHKPSILILNKLDLLKNRKDALPIIAAFDKMKIFDEIVPLSALKGFGIDELIKVFEQYLPEAPFYYDPEQISNQTERFFVSEIIRESIFLGYREEIPYSSEVNIVEYKERQSGKWYISAELIIEKDSQKGIIIGVGGSKLKEIGNAARLAIEEHLGVEIYLDIFVKVRKNWRNNKNMLKSFGY